MNHEKVIIEYSLIKDLLETGNEIVEMLDGDTDLSPEDYKLIGKYEYLSEVANGLIQNRNANQMLGCERHDI